MKHLINLPKRLNKIILFLLFITYTLNNNFMGIAWGFQKMRKPDGIVIHSSLCKNYLNNHKRHFHFIITKNGNIKKGAPENQAVYHIRGKFNNSSFSILIDTSKKRKPIITNKQKNALKKILSYLMKKYDIPLSQIERHYDRNISCNCPGINFPYFEILYSMAKDLIKNKGNPLLEDICKDKNIPIPIKNAKIIVYKSKYLLRLYSKNTLLKDYNIGLSNRPKGDKLKKGDRKTPLGYFYICEKYPMRAWMEFSYPNIRNAKIGLKKGIINKKKYNKILLAIKNGNIPYHHSKMGNDVGIHAGGFTYGKMRIDYTAGCIGMEDPEAYEIYYAVPLGTKVIIFQ